MFSPNCGVNFAVNLELHLDECRCSNIFLTLPSLFVNEMTTYKDALFLTKFYSDR